ncbi:isoflavone reductase [Bisporella sp. PMI_857]|nr:isoflavone reductase [Bisporella sp. PMI_857]
MSIKNVIIVGAGGNLGAGILPEILKSDLSISVLSRENSTSSFPDGVKVIKSDYSLESLTKIFTSQDAVVSLISSSSLDGQVVVLEAAVAAGVKRIIPSDFGNDTASDTVNAALPFFAPKAKAIEYLRENENKISWTSIITGPFFDWGLPLGFLGFNFADHTVSWVDGGKARFTSTNLNQIGRSVVAVLKNPNLTANKFVYPESFTTTQTDILAIIEKETGSAWRKDPVNSKDLRAAGWEKIKAGDLLSGAAYVIQAGFLGEQALEDHTAVPGGSWNERLGLPTETVEATVREVVTRLGKK